MRRLAFIFLIAIAHSSILYAGDAESVHLMVGRSAVLDVGSPIARVSLTSAEIADAMVTSSSQVLINGKMPGTISLFVWDRGGVLKRYEVVVQRDLARLSDQLTQLFPGESIAAQSNGKSVVLSGSVSKKDVIDKAVSVAAGYVEKKDDVVSLLQVRESGGAEQVLLRVRFAEVSRNALTELGAGLFTSPTGVKNTLARVTTQQFPAPGFDSLKWTKESGAFGAPVTSAEGKFTFGDFLNFFLFSQKYDIGMMVRALQSRGLFQSLAEPNLVAESGKEASFLAGGEFPVPIAQPSNGGTSVTIMFKEFGIRLNFTPVVNGDRVHLKVRPEVSTLDFANGITMQGFRVPALSTRRTETELELQNGQTFAIAGLINNTMNKTLQKVPGIGDIPILGLLFKSQAAQKDRTELVVMITPEILQRGSSGVTPNLPKLAEPFLPTVEQKKAIEPPPPAFRPATGTAQAPTTSPNVTQVSPSAQPALDPAAAAAAVAALTPSTKPVVKTNSQPARPMETNTAAPSRKLTRDEQNALEHSRQAERESAERNSKAAKQLARQADVGRKKADEDKKVQAEAQKRQAVIDKAAQEVAAKRAAEQAKKQAEIDKKQQKAVAEAEAKFKAAQAAYEAETARAKKQQ